MLVPACQPRREEFVDFTDLCPPRCGDIFLFHESSTGIVLPPYIVRPFSIGMLNKQPLRLITSPLMRKMG